MPRYLIRVRPELREEVKARLPAGAVTVEQVFDYILVEMPEELVPQVRRIEGVIEVKPERRVHIMQRFPLPVERKLEEFMRLAANPLTLPRALQYALQADVGKVRWSTMESRKVLGAGEAEAEGITGKGVKVAVLDTGWDPACPTAVQHFVSSVEGQPFPGDENGHGTHCYTTIAGRAMPTPWGWIKGVAPEAEIGVFKVLGYGMGAGTEMSVMRGMVDALAWGADIISMSLGGPECEDYRTCPQCILVSALKEQGIIFVVAAGNEGPEPHTLGCPGSGPDALTVGAIDINGELADFSSRGPSRDGRVKPDCMAPGVDILSSTCGMIDFMQFMDGPKLGAISGTSMATPHCAGIVALIKQLYRNNGVELTTNMIKNILETYGEPKTNERGHGLLTWSMAKKYLEEL